MPRLRQLGRREAVANRLFGERRRRRRQRQRLSRRRLRRGELARARVAARLPHELLINVAAEGEHGAGGGGRLERHGANAAHWIEHDVAGLDTREAQHQRRRRAAQPRVDGCVRHQRPRLGRHLHLLKGACAHVDTHDELARCEQCHHLKLVPTHARRPAVQRLHRAAHGARHVDRSERVWAVANARCPKRERAEWLPGLSALCEDAPRLERPLPASRVRDGCACLLEAIVVEADRGQSHGCKQTLQPF